MSHEVSFAYIKSEGIDTTCEPMCIESLLNVI